MPLTSEARSLAETLIDGARKTVQNADELFDEARLLADAGHVARALLLHQISLEECGKLEMLYVATAEVLRGQAVDMKRLSRAFSKHAAKWASPSFPDTSNDMMCSGDRHDKNSKELHGRIQT